MCPEIGPLAPQSDPPRRFRPADPADDIPSSPPAAVLAAVAAAQRRSEDLHAQDRELHFTHDEATGRLVVQVRTLDGRVLHAIQPSRALDIMSGEAF
jgi:hypothetical protein